MKKIRLFFLSFLLFASTGFAATLTLDNETPYPKQNARIAVQWASNAKEVQEGNQAIMRGAKMDDNSIQTISQQGTIKLTIPQNAEFFRVLIWSNNSEAPDLLTNWVDVSPNKTYTLKGDHLVPAVLMPGSGC